MLSAPCVVMDESLAVPFVLWAGITAALMLVAGLSYRAFQKKSAAA